MADFAMSWLFQLAMHAVGFLGSLAILLWRLNVAVARLEERILAASNIGNDHDERIKWLERRNGRR
jgi:hypothetical protein